MKVLQCKKCEKTVCVIKDHGCPTICCGDPMEELVANTTDAATEKHVPVVTVEEGIYHVVVGEVEHPMTEEHHIAWIALEGKQGTQRKFLDPTGKPEAFFALAGGDEAVAVYEYCNLHGLWKIDL